MIDMLYSYGFVKGKKSSLLQHYWNKYSEFPTTHRLTFFSHGFELFLPHSSHCDLHVLSQPVQIQRVKCLKPKRSNFTFYKRLATYSTCVNPFNAALPQTTLPKHPCKTKTKSLKTLEGRRNPWQTQTVIKNIVQGEDT